ncbi:MAG: DUF6879 family protein [Pseudonocardiaceae bacterium]
MLNIDQLGHVLDDTRSDLFRWEALPTYEVPTDGSDFHRWLAGEPAPTMDRKQVWLDTLRAWAEQGRPRRRVRVIHDPPSDYERYSCEWGYVHTAAAGERIRVLDLAETAMPSELVAVSDFWLIDGERVVLMYYNSDYTFAGGELLDQESSTGPYRDAASVAWRLGCDFATWWADHPQYRRSPS